MSLVLDASVALLWLAPETIWERGECSKSVLRKNPDGDFLMPSLFPLEVAKVASKLQRKGFVTIAQTNHLTKARNSPSRV